MDNTMKEAYEKRHKQAFRISFDALAEVFPPEDTVEYFEKTNERLKEIYNENCNNPLLKALMVAIANYLGAVVKETKE